MDTLTWESIIEDRMLQNLPYKIETNRYNKIIMSPASFWHSDYQGEIGALLKSHMRTGRVPTECAVQTTDGIRVADVAWISSQRRAPYRSSVALPIAPEICVEIVSPSNRREEMLEKMSLYFAKGAEEVWLCDAAGQMEFFTALSAPHPVPVSVLCPSFPTQIEVD